MADGRSHPGNTTEAVEGIEFIARGTTYSVHARGAMYLLEAIGDGSATDYLVIALTSYGEKVASRIVGTTEHCPEPGRALKVRALPQMTLEILGPTELLCDIRHSPTNSTGKLLNVAERSPGTWLVTDGQDLYVVTKTD